jgi:hypothetical protein
MKFVLTLLISYLLINSVTTILKVNRNRESLYKANSYSVYSIETNIILPKRSDDAVINEKVMFKVSEGIYSNFTRKIYSDAPNIFSTISNSKYTDIN